MGIKNQTVTDQFGFTRDKMYIDDLDQNAIFDFFRENAPFGVGFGTTEEVARNYNFRPQDMYYSKEKGKMDCYYMPKHKVALGNVCAGFSFDDFSCEYYDNSANKVDLSHKWCKFVCAELDSAEYFMDYLAIMKERISDLNEEHNRQVNEIYTQISEVSNSCVAVNDREESVVADDRGVDCDCMEE